MTVVALMMTHTLLRLCLLVAGATACERSKAAAATGEVMVARDVRLPAEIAADSILAAADRSLRAGHAWHATQLLAPLLRDPSRRTPAAVLLAARAAAGWDGWDEVEKLLAGERWLDSRYNGEGRELLARAALQRGDDTSAVANAGAAVARAPNARTRAMRLVLLARALDRGDQKDSARVAYASAAAGLRDVRDWLLLRAAGVDADSADRARLYASMTSPIARSRIRWTEAQALERSGDLAAAASRYAALGATTSALRLRLSMPSDAAGRARVEDELLAFIRAKSGAGDARTAVELLDKYFPSLTPAQELIVARSAAASGPVVRALAAYGRARTAGLTTPNDVLQYGELLARAGRYPEAIAQFDAIDTASALAGQAVYQRARALLSSGNRAGARDALRAIPARFASDTAAAAPAMYLLADLATDDGQDSGARALLRDLASRYPTSARAGDARFRAGLISYVLADYRRAAAELDSAVAAYPGSSEAAAATYWSGRAWAATGDSAAARSRWREIARRDPLSYYAAASARRLGERPWTPPARADSFLRIAAVDAAMRRVALLERLGMDAEARFEEDALEEAADSSAARLLATSAAFRAAGVPSRGIRLAWRALERGAPKDARAYRLVYPVLHRDVLSAQAKAHALDPALVAGLIRQESNFNPRAVSPAGARGLMQVMPSVGQAVARNLRFPLWDPVLLFDPDANLEIGTAHLAGSVKEYGTLVRVLAAYNAGGSRATRWSTKAGMDDPELYAERIPFAETRDYVRIVQRNAELYRALYSW